MIPGVLEYRVIQAVLTLALSKIHRVMVRVIHGAAVVHENVNVPCSADHLTGC